VGIVRSVHPGASFCLVLLDDKSVWGWGFVGRDQGVVAGVDNGGAALSPTCTAIMSDVRALWVGGDMAIVRARDGETFSLGRGSHMLAPSEAPPMAHSLQGRPALNPYRQFTIGRHHGFAIDVWGNVIGFGCAANGALGTGQNRPDLKLAPTKLHLGTLPLAAAGHYSLGLL
jgi:alpha-tubulin suppressor-like RCC1 family protein